MSKQTNLDLWLINYLSSLLRKCTHIIKKINKPIILYRQTVEESGNVYEEIVCTLTDGYIVEQLVISGGFLVPSFRQQFVFTINEFTEKMILKSRELFLQIIDVLENYLTQTEYK